MRRTYFLVGAGLALTSGWALAQKSPESLLPPGFDKPAASSSAAPAPSIDGPGMVSQPVIQPLPAATTAAPRGPITVGDRTITLAQLQAMTPEQLDEALGLKPTSDMPPAARRAMTRVGTLDEAEGGLPAASFASQPAALVSAALQGTRGPLVSRWGHILLRRALASRLTAPAGMNPADFAAQRAALLVRMGEGEAARALVQDVDTANYTPALMQAAADAYVFTADFTGMCPMVTLHGGARKDAQWDVTRAICTAFEGDGNQALSQLDRALSRGRMDKVDLLLAQKYAGAAGKARRAVKIEWDDVSELTPWRYGLTIAVGLEPPANLMKNAPARIDYMAATAPMLGLPARAGAADRAGGQGILSSAAMVDLYSQIRAQEDIEGPWAERAGLLRSAYAAPTIAERMAAIKDLWAESADPRILYSRQVLTAYAAARLPVDTELADDAGPLIASMLAAGLDRNAQRWASVAETGSEAWGLLALSAPGQGSQVTTGQLTSFHDNDESEASRKSAFLLAGLAALGRITPETTQEFGKTLAVDLARPTRWSRLIDQAAEVNNAGLVVLLSAVGMQGTGWDKMTARHLYHIVSALRRVGLEAEARMIAAEAVARG
ncbi:MAG: hypothetical protein WCY11_04770 [Novosphingobium sp.]